MILFEILKVIAYILLILLLVVLISVLLVLIVPAFYRFVFNSEDCFKVNGRFSVLFGLVSFNIDSDTEEKFSIKILWHQLKSINVAEDETQNNFNEDYKNEEALFNMSVKFENSNKEPEIPKEYDNVFDKIFNNIKEFILKIISSVKKIISNAKNAVNKTERIIDFLNDDDVVTAFTNHKSRVFKILRHLGPKKSDLCLEFGYDDPAVVGYILAVISPFYGLYANWVKIIPYFDCSTFKLNGSIKGRASLLFLLWHVIRVYFDRNVKNIRNNYKTSGEGEY